MRSNGVCNLRLSVLSGLQFSKLDLRKFHAFLSPVHGLKADDSRTPVIVLQG
jgi:hypothetical protein